MSECGDDPRRNLFIAYDNQQPSTGSDVTGEIAFALGIDRIDFDMLGRRHSEEYIIAERRQLDVLEQHLLQPYAGEENYPSALKVGRLSDESVVGHYRKDAARLGWYRRAQCSSSLPEL